MNDLVSIITPIYNAEKYLAEAIQSVLDQTHENWELLLVNDGSTDQSEEIARFYSDVRIRYFEQENKGVSAARNVGLTEMKGRYFCFLDADDTLPSKSIEVRLQVFTKNPHVDFVDGTVVSYDFSMKKERSKWHPSYTGNPLKELINLKDTCFFGVMWMIRRKQGKTYRFDTSITFGEDLWFFIELAQEGGVYNFTLAPGYFRRMTPGSAMKNMGLLAEGYHKLYEKIATLNVLNSNELKSLRRKIHLIILKSSLRAFKLGVACKELIRVVK